MTDIATVAPRSRALAERLLRIPWPILLAAAAIAACGAVALYSVAGGSLHPWSERHVLRFLLAAGLAIALAVVPIRAWIATAYPLYGLALLLLALVPLVGTEALGARRWLSIAGFSLQPSEIMKLALILALARYYHWLPPARRSHPLFALAPLLMIAAPTALILRQPDLGTAVLLVVLGLGIMFLAGVSPLYFIAGAGGAWLAWPYVQAGLHDYQRRRIAIFLDPEQDPLGAGYHIAQSKIAVGSGGSEGKGLLQGTQAQLDFIPEKHTDFIFAMIGEEWGFAGSLGLLGLYALLLALLLWTALACRHQLGRLLIAGAGLMVFIYVFINIAMVAGLVPVVGVPLPLVSYGGTSMVIVLLALGLAMNAHVHRDELLRPEEVGALL
jgi:rod shape determining protein RodA